MHRGDEPLAGVIRKAGAIEHDLIVSRGYAARVAVETATDVAGLPMPVATPLALLLLKLVAGAARDRLDVLELVRTCRIVDDAPWLSALPSQAGHLPRVAQCL